MTEDEEPGWVVPGAVPPPDHAVPPPAPAVPPPYAAAPPPYPMGSPRTEDMAVAALVLAFMSFIMPVVTAIAAFVTAAIAARRIRRAPAGTLRGRGLVIAASVVAAISLLVWVGITALVVVALVQQEDAPPRASATGAAVPSGREVGVETLRVGDCVNDATLKEDGEVDTVRVVPCWLPHDLEVYANQTVLGDSFPGDDKVSSFAEQSCAEGFERYVGAPPGDAGLDYFAYLPGEAGWEAGDHVVTCGVVDPAGGKLTGSARGAGTPASATAATR